MGAAGAGAIEEEKRRKEQNKMEMRSEEEDPQKMTGRTDRTVERWANYKGHESSRKNES